MKMIVAIIFDWLILLIEYYHLWLMDDSNHYIMFITHNQVKNLDNMRIYFRY